LRAVLAETDKYLLSRIAADSDSLYFSVNKLQTSHGDGIWDTTLRA